MKYQENSPKLVIFSKNRMIFKGLFNFKYSTRKTNKITNKKGDCRRSKTWYKLRNIKTGSMIVELKRFDERYIEMKEYGKRCKINSKFIISDLFKLRSNTLYYFRNIG